MSNRVAGRAKHDQAASDCSAGALSVTELPALKGTPLRSGSIFWAQRIGTAAGMTTLSRLTPNWPRRQK